MRIITLTLNPAFDVHCFGENLTLYHENFVKSTAAEAGGKGINLSRALLTNGIESEAIVIVGRENGEQYQNALARDGLKIIPIFTDGRIRENITIHEENRPETRISFSGFSCDADILRKIKECVGTVDEDTVIAFTGSISAGIDIDDVLSFLNGFRENGAKIVIDSRSVAFEKLVKFRPWLIKPNKEEAERYAGGIINGIENALTVAKGFQQEGISNVLLTLGGEGAVLACDSGLFYAKAPAVEARSTIGAGDSTIAGFIDAAMHRLTVQDTLKRAVSYGTAACLQEGTLPPHRKDIQALERQVEIQRR